MTRSGWTVLAVLGDADRHPAVAAV